MEEYKITNDIRPRGLDSAYVIGPFDKAKEALESEGYEVIGLKENAKLRIEHGANSFVSRNGNWTREGVLYLPDKRILLVSNNPIMQNAKYATACHRKREKFYLTDEQVESSLEGSIDLRGKPIPTNRFAEDTRTAQIFGEVVGDYGLFLKEARIEEMPIWLDFTEDKAFVRPVWFDNLDNGSLLDGNVGGLVFGGRMRGVKGGEATQKISRSYTSFTNK